MKLAKIRVKSFQSFADSGNVEFGDGINLIIGQNNAGKSALLRALLPGLPDDRHRAAERWQTHRLPMPDIEFNIHFSGEELQEWVFLFNTALYFPIPNNEVPNAKTIVESFFSRPQMELSVTRRPNEPFQAPYPSHRLFHYQAPGQQACASIVPVNGELNIEARLSNDDTLPQQIWNAWGRDMFYFAPERMMVGEASHGYANRLVPTASNLPNVLHTLRNERGDIFDELVEHLREIFPTIGNLSVRTKPENQYLEVRVWPTEEMRTHELSFPLNSGGTGVSQVVAILTAIMTVERAVVVIDEINSFLHPAAVKSLLRILQTRYPSNQYIISTHAPEVISFANPSTIHLVKRAGYESSIESLDLNEVGKFREVAGHLGISMTDVFAADRVIWVEGHTEELCFPYLYQSLTGPVPRGTSFMSVVATGDFVSKRRDREFIFEVYRRLSSASATLVVSVAFSFDSETLTADDKERMRRESGHLIHFLPRRHFECYLLDPDAILAFIVDRDPHWANRLAPESVVAALSSAAAQRPFHIPEWDGSLANQSWLAKVDAANLITHVVGSLSDQRVRFSKKKDSLFLLKYILANKREQLASLQNYVSGLVQFVAD